MSTFAAFIPLRHGSVAAAGASAKGGKRTLPPPSDESSFDHMTPMLPFLALFAFAVQAAERPLSVREVMESAEAFDGQEVLVSGWVEECQPLSCILYASRREGRRDWPRYWLSIGSSTWFDAFARRNAPGPVTLRARFSARCVTDPRSGVIALCADRVNSLDPLAIAR
jgi:hypothetical protein